MRKLFTLTMVVIFAAAAFSPALAVQEGQQQEGQEQEASTFRGKLETVDVEAQTMAVAASEEGDPITIEVTEETTIQGPEGELTLADLSQHQGANLEVRYVMQEQSVVALEVNLITS